MANGEPYPTAGPTVASWIENSLVHGEGDALGMAIRLEPFQRYILNRIYEFDPQTGQLLHDRVLVGTPKGNAKTELIANVGLAEMAGPLSPRSPNVAVGAASWEQADKLFGAARYAIEGDGESRGKIADFFKSGDHIQQDRILRPDRPGKLYRIAAVAGTNDGGLQTAFLGDELHEWEGDRRERVWTVMSKAVRKRRVPRPLSPKLARFLGVDELIGALLIGITTAGDTLDSLLGRLFLHGTQVAAGEVEDPSFLFMWWQMNVHVKRPGQEDDGEGWDLDDPDQRLQAILEANPAAGSFLPIAGLEASYRDPTVPLDEFLRYNGNLFVSHPDAWLSEALVDGRRVDPVKIGDPPPKGTPIVVGFDGSNNRDCTALVGWTLESDYGFVIDAWEPKDNEPVPRVEVDAAVRRSFAEWNVVEFAGDPPGWRSELETWEAEFGSRVIDDANDRVVGTGKILRFPTFVYQRFGPACAEFKTAFIEGGPTFDGHPMFVRHLKNTRARDTRYGQVAEKESKSSTRRIDLADAAIVARHRARWHVEHPSKPHKPRIGVGF